MHNWQLHIASKVTWLNPEDQWLNPEYQWLTNPLLAFCSLLKRKNLTDVNCEQQWKLFLQNLLSRSACEWECDQKWKRAEPAGDDSQVTLPSLDPHQLLWEGGGGGGDKRWVAWQMMETRNDSLSPLSTPTLLRSFTPPHHHPQHTYITVPSATR